MRKPLYYLFSNQQRFILENLLEFYDTSDVDSYMWSFRYLMEFAWEKGRTEKTVLEYLLYDILNQTELSGMLEHPQSDAYLQADAQLLFDTYFSIPWNEYCEKAGVLVPPVGCNGEKNTPYDKAIHRLVHATSGEELAKELKCFFSQYADTKEATFSNFRWTGAEEQPVIGISQPDAISFEQLYGLEEQKKVLIQNVQGFVEGAPFNDVLLVGARGTGKSSCVKAVAGHFQEKELKLIELSSSRITELSQVMEYLRLRKCKYILFLDDLNFTGEDGSYANLKVALDGQLESRPNNVLLMATSNRRNLVTEYWSDREGGEVHENDALNDKLSLAERFGIRLYFSALSQKEYLEIVAITLETYGIPYTKEIGEQANAWAMSNNGRSGRTAKQFVSYYRSLAE